MKTSIEFFLFGLTLTAVIFFCSISTIPSLLHSLDVKPGSYIPHISMLLLAATAIGFNRKYVSYKISSAKLKPLLKSFSVGVIISLTPIIVNIIATISNLPIGGNPAIKELNLLQFFLYIFILASIAEEVLFRGFFQNILNPLKSINFNIYKVQISLPVLISGIIFGLAHFVVMLSGANLITTLNIVLFTTLLGIAAGYYQEKYENNIYAIATHMGGNFLGLLGILLTTLNSHT